MYKCSHTSHHCWIFIFWFILLMMCVCDDYYNKSYHSTNNLNQFQVELIQILTEFPANFIQPHLQIHAKHDAQLSLHEYDVFCLWKMYMMTVWMNSIKTKICSSVNLSFWAKSLPLRGPDCSSRAPHHQWAFMNIIPCFLIYFRCRHILLTYSF